MRNTGSSKATTACSKIGEPPLEKACFLLSDADMAFQPYVAT